MNDKKDGSEEKHDSSNDTASLLESLFKDTKSSQIKVVKRRMRPKSVVKKRVASKRRKGEGEETSQSPAQKRGRPSPSEKITRETKSKTLSRKASPPRSVVQKDSETEQSRQRLRRTSTAGAEPTPKSIKVDAKRITRPVGPEKEKPSSKSIAGPGEERTESLDQSVLNSMISMASGIRWSRKRPRHELSPEDRQRVKPKRDHGEKSSETDDLRTGPPGETEGIAGADEEITEVLKKSTLDSMISEIEGSGKEGHRKTPAKESPVPAEEEAGATIFFDDGDTREETSADIKGVAGKNKEITDLLGKSALDSMSSEIRRRGKRGDRKTSAEESPMPGEEETGAEIFFDNGALREGTSSDTEGIAGADEEITDVLEKSALVSMISALEGSGEEAQNQVSAEKSSVSEEEETIVGVVVDSDDLKEASAEIEGIDGATEEDLLSQEKPAAPSSIIIEDSLLEASAVKDYPESPLEEKSIPEDRKEAVEKASQAIDLKEEQPSDSANDELTEERTLPQEKPAASASKPYKIPETKADRLEVHHILAEKERPPLEDKEEGVEQTSEAVGLETGLLSDPSWSEKEELRFQEIFVPNIMSSEDSEDYTGEEKHHHLPAAEQGPTPKGEEDHIEEVSEPEESKREKADDLEEGIALTEAELQLIKRSGRRAKVMRIGLPLVLFGVLVVILSILYSPLDFFRGEQTEELVSDRAVESSSPKKKEITAKTVRETASAAKEGVQTSTPTPAKREIIRAPVPKRRAAIPETQKETVAAVTPKVKPSTSEPPTILAMKESVERPSSMEQDTSPRTSKETFATKEQEVQPDAAVTPKAKPSTSEPPTILAMKESIEEPASMEQDATPKTSEETFPTREQEVQPEAPGSETPPLSSDATAKAEANQRETSAAYPYTVYLGSYRTPESLEKALLVYNENGLSSLYWQEVDLGDKGIWYRVFTGHFRTEGEAEEYVEDRQIADAEVQKTKQGASVRSVSTEDVVPQAEASEERRRQPEAIAGSSYPYSVYIGSYKNVDRARKAVSESQPKGTSYWVKTDLGDKGIWYRVYVGCFETRDQAETFIKTHQIADGESRRTTYANLIGTYRSNEELEKMRLSLLNLEFSPYVIETSDGGSHLFTGAFYQKARAEKEHLDLKAKGIESQLVER